MGGGAGQETLTILFTDVEGSTAFRTREGDAAGNQVMTAHERLVEEQVGDPGGRLIKALGDGCLAVFASPRRALERAVAIGRQAGPVVEGIAASGGRYTGPARIVRSESELEKVEPGDILVCPGTSPAWSPVFPSIGALVTDTGGILSHAAIIAREFTIPTVVATGNATDLFADGQLITVDGDAGRVRAE